MHGFETNAEDMDKLEVKGSFEAGARSFDYDVIADGEREDDRTPIAITFSIDQLSAFESHIVHTPIFTF